MKHAYLIIAHNEFGILRKLIELLDCENNALYIHIDKKVRGFDFEDYRKHAKKASIVFVTRIKVNWGAFSQIRCELLLLKEAVRDEHDYYHLISGCDLPLKSNEYIDNFFADNNGKLFLASSGKIFEGEFYDRVRYYHFFQELCGNQRKIIAKVFRYFRKRLIRLQKCLKINRAKKNGLVVHVGSNWFSIPHAFAKFVCEKEEFIEGNFKYTHCGDELFLQALASQSGFRSSLTNNNCRYIDWKRGGPYVFRKEDYPALMASDKLWARKFSETIDPDIVNDIFETLLQR